MTIINYFRKIKISKLEYFVSWVLSIYSVAMGVGFTILRSLEGYPELEYIVIFLAAGILFCPEVKVPTWIRVVIAIGLLCCF